MLLVALGLSANAQDADKNQGLYGIIQLGYVKNSTLVYRYQSQSTTYDAEDAHVRSINVLMGYYIMPKKLSLGAGFGIDGFRRPDFGTLPLYLDLRYYFTEKRNTFYARTNYGGYISTGPPFTTKGRYFRLGGGYKAFLTRKLCLNFDISYAPARLTEPNNEYWNINGVAFSLGFVLF
ncbi:MAG: hypothetical protein HC819_23805 [Cyclobacteriaceae bacterium]|nr:hypothetical protein [Cyclobacteriaceae bacterium]